MSLALKIKEEGATKMHTVTGLNPQDGKPIEIIVRDGIIHAINASGRDEEQWVSRGFVDLQVNGYGGDDVNMEEPDPQAIVSLTAKMIAAGVTTYLPTIITASEEKITAALRAVARARQSNKLVAECVPYVHVEGPHISPLDGFRGAHPVEQVRPPNLAEFARWQQASSGLVGMVTLSPHFEESEEYISRLTAQGVHVSIGHTHASADQIHKAVDAGARLSTHLGNGIAGMIARHPNPIWTQLSDDRLTASMIADGHHLPGDTLKAMVRTKGIDRSILVSDAVALAGLPAGIYDAPIGGRVELRSDGRLSLLGTEFLAGAVLPLKDGIARAMSMAGISLGESIQMATVNPGRFVGGAGVLAVGMPADLVRFNIESGESGLRIERVFVKGKEWS
jgi:N-acetylglucosamine-6-phosphate deacetylase